MTEIQAIALEELLSRLRGSEDLPENEVASVQAVVQGKDSIALEGTLVDEKEAHQNDAGERATPPPKALTQEGEADVDIRTAISKMNLPQKVKLALFGNAICRGLLIRDPNKLIQTFVLKNPKIGLNEVEDFAKNPNLSDAVLRTIANQQQWLRSYTLKANLVSNPKTPLDVALKWLRFLNMTDLKKIARSKNVSQVISTAAKKIVTEAEQR